MNQSQHIEDPLDMGWRDKPPSLRSYSGMVRRQAPLVFLYIVASIFISLAFIVLAEPKYTASVSLSLDAETGGTDAPRSEVATAIDLDTHVELIRSDHTTATVIDSLDLAKVPEFSPDRSRIGAMVSRVRKQLGLDPAETEKVDPMLAVINKVRSGLKVARNGNTRVLDLQYTSRSPTLAVSIVNAFARAYLDSITSRDTAATTRRIDRLNQRAEDVRKMAAAADARIRSILHESGLFTADPLELQGRISALRAELSAHDAKVAALSAKLAVYAGYAQNSDGASIDTPEGRRLLSELVAAKQRLLDVQQKAAANSNSVSATENGIRNLEASLQQEISFAVNATELERAATIAERENIAGQLTQLGDFVASDAWAELEDVRQQKIVYDGMYQDYLKQIEGAARDKQSRTDLRIVADALTPTTPSSPNIKVWLAIAITLATMIGLGVAAIREWNRYEQSRV
ncbi:MAG: GumC family protein [bacterium]